MSKRFTDTEKWNKPFIRRLKAPYKLLWLYILDECDHAGIWQVDFEVAKIKIGEKTLKESEALEALKENIYPFSNGEKWFIPDFIEFQYGKLSADNRAHNSAINILSKYNLFEDGNIIKPLISPLQAPYKEAKNKDKDMDMDKDKEQLDRITTAARTLEDMIEPYRSKYADAIIDEFLNYWKEPEQKTGKQRWQFEKFFDAGRRLTTWVQRAKTHFNTPIIPIEPKETPEEKIARLKKLNQDYQQKKQ